MRMSFDQNVSTFYLQWTVLIPESADRTGSKSTNRRAERKHNFLWISDSTVIEFCPLTLF